MTISEIEKTIGYSFENRDLLQQAFTRRSYTEENGGENNEALEFTGDSALNLAVVRILKERFGCMTLCEASEETLNQNEITLWKYIGSQPKQYLYFHSKVDEATLSRLRSRMVSKKTLSRRMDALGLIGHLRMGRGDCMKSIQNEASVKEDTFEAIIGAVALDCNWNMDKVTEVVRKMLCPEDYLSDAQLPDCAAVIRKWSLSRGYALPEPIFHPFPWGFSISMVDILKSQSHNIKHQCDVTLPTVNVSFIGCGITKSDAEEDAWSKAYEYLKNKGMLCSLSDEITNPVRDEAINQLETLARKGFFSLPTYEFSEDHDENGRPIWTCVCCVEEKKVRSCKTSHTKKEAKKDAAYAVLLQLLKTENK
ncbi:MAG: hypothetical protein HUJ66_06425 [Oscillospiraceae bacterium]|nr:hypothetical protein [Oscillospiraceae bacterium]